MSALPKWIENIKIRGTSEVHSQLLLEALAITWEALQRIECRHCNGEAVKETMSRIEELGK